MPLALAIYFSRRTQKSILKLLFIIGLPDGLFSNQNINLGKFWRALD
jgi:hypothetical protein